MPICCSDLTSKHRPALPLSPEAHSAAGSQAGQHRPVKRSLCAGACRQPNRPEALIPAAGDTRKLAERPFVRPTLMLSGCISIMKSKVFSISCACFMLTSCRASVLNWACLCCSASCSQSLRCSRDSLMAGTYTSTTKSTTERIMVMSVLSGRLACAERVLKAIRANGMLMPALLGWYASAAPSHCSWGGSPRLMGCAEDKLGKDAGHMKEFSYCASWSRWVRWSTH